MHFIVGITKMEWHAFLARSHGRLLAKFFEYLVKFPKPNKLLSILLILPPDDRRPSEAAPRRWPLPDGWLICKRTSDNKASKSG